MVNCKRIIADINDTILKYNLAIKKTEMSRAIRDQWVEKKKAVVDRSSRAEAVARTQGLQQQQQQQQRPFTALRMSFCLPSGSYATMLIREIIKPDHADGRVGGQLVPHQLPAADGVKAAGAAQEAETASASPPVIARRCGRKIYFA